MALNGSIKQRHLEEQRHLSAIISRELESNEEPGPFKQGEAIPPLLLKTQQEIFSCDCDVKNGQAFRIITRIPFQSLSHVTVVKMP